MTFNKIPLALGFNSSTGNASGLVEFTLDLSNVGDVCEATPTEGQTLVYSSTTGKWCPSTIVTGGGGGGGIPTPNTPLATGDILAYNGASWQASTTSELNLPTLNGTNTFTEANSFGVTTTTIDTNGILKLSNVEPNSLMITDSASAVSSLSGASGSIVCFEGTTPAPGLKTFVELLEDLVGSLQGGDILYVNAAGNLARLPKGSTGQVLTLDAGRMPSWSGGG
tara:strand:- start:152 stop:823 length:672 start_codon:yes stop_codon:yes gene_type:complete